VVLGINCDYFYNSFDQFIVVMLTHLVLIQAEAGYLSIVPV
jgi:hypothetical protein